MKINPVAFGEHLQCLDWPIDIERLEGREEEHAELQVRRCVGLGCLYLSEGYQLSSHTYYYNGLGDTVPCVRSLIVVGEREETIRGRKLDIRAIVSRSTAHRLGINILAAQFKALVDLLPFFHVSVARTVHTALSVSGLH